MITESSVCQGISRTPVDLNRGLVGILFCGLLACFIPSFRSFFLSSKTIFKCKILEVEKCVLKLTRNQQKGHRTGQSEAVSLPAH